MDEIQITKLIFGIYLSVSAAVLLLIAFKLYYKYLINDRICNKTKEKSNSKSEKIRTDLFVLAPIIIVSLPVIFIVVFFVALVLLANSGVITIGAVRFIQTAVIHGGLGLLAVIIAIASIIKLARSDKSSRQILGRTVMIVVCAAAAFFLIRPLILDIPYLKHPETIYLGRLEFDHQIGIGDSLDACYLRGVDMAGGCHLFNIGEKKFDEGQKLWSGNNCNLFAEVTCLPHTNTLMTVKFNTTLPEALTELYPPSPDLPGDWESFSIQINDSVYTLPVSISAFLDDGWEISEEDAGIYLAGTDGPHASYEWEWLSLTNGREQTVSVCVFNTTESTISVTESTVGGISAIYENYDFSGTELRLPGGLMLGWSTKEDVIGLYGEPNDIFEASSMTYSKLTYKTDATTDTAFWKISFDESDILNDVMVHHQAYFRSN